MATTRGHLDPAQIKAFGLNRMDIMQRQGKYPLPPQASKTIMGVEFAGEVVKMHEDGGDKSENGEKWKLGDQVVGLAYGVRRPRKTLGRTHRY